MPSRSQLHIDGLAPTSKVCTQCGIDKPLEDFYTATWGLYGHASACKPCATKWTMKSRERYPERVKAEHQRFHQRHRERRVAQMRVYRAEHREELNRKSAEWAAANPEKVKANKSKRKARLRGADVSCPHVGEYVEIVLGDPCAYCGTESTTVDHIQAIATGGHHEWSNVTGACVSCNASKRHRPLLTFLLACS